MSDAVSCCYNIKCNRCKARDIEYIRMKNKLERYQRAIDILLEEDSEEIELVDDNTYYSNNTNNFLYESLIVESNNEGEMVTKAKPDIGESFMVVDNCKNLNELSREERRSIRRQSDFASYDKVSKASKKGSFLYSIGSTAVSVGRYFIGFF